MLIVYMNDFTAKNFFSLSNAFHIFCMRNVYPLWSLWRVLSAILIPCTPPMWRELFQQFRNSNVRNSVNPPLRNYRFQSSAPFYQTTGHFDLWFSCQRCPCKTWIVLQVTLKNKDVLVQGLRIFSLGQWSPLTDWIIPLCEMLGLSIKETSHKLSSGL